MRQYLADHELVDDESQQSDSSIFFENLVNKVVSLWPWLIASVVVCTGLAFVYYKSATPIYTASASLLVQDDKKGADFGEANLLQDLGFLVNKSNVDNEVEILKSRTLMEQVVKELQLNVHYFIEGKLKKKEIFHNRPISLKFAETSYASPLNGEYNVFINKDKQTFRLVDGDKILKGRIGDSVQISSGKAAVVAEKGLAYWSTEQSLLINVGRFDGTTRQYMGSLRIMVPNKLVSVIDLAMNEILPDKGEAVLNKLIEVYLQANVNDKSRTADSTVKFIDERLQLVFKELSGIENDIEGFKTRNKITDVSEQARILLENTSEYSKQLTAQEVQLSVVNELEKFLEKNIDNTRVVPASLVIQDANFISLVQEYNQVQSQRDRLAMSQTTLNPGVASMDEQLRNLRKALLSSIASIKQGVEVSIKELKNKTTAFESQISKIPTKERMFLDYSRQQAIKQELYLFLLKKREETAISKSSTIANARIIDKAKANNVPISPVRNKFLMIGLILGIVIPFGVSYAKDFLNNKVSSINDISAYTKVPVLAEIGHNPAEKVVAIDVTSRTVIAEQFRSLRTSLQYVLPSEGKKVILVTSSMSGEGKSFLSINLCSSLALAGKNVVLLEFDLRRPKITENLKLERRGFTNFLVTNDENWRQWIQKSGVHDNFKVLSSGPLPPNPSELLMLPKVEKLFQNLKDNFDYIVIDTAPIGLVTDAQVLAGLADLTLYVVRHGFTYKQQLKMVERLHRKGSMPKMNIIVNDIQVKKAAYGYGYNTYGYSVYGYGSDH